MKRIAEIVSQFINSIRPRDALGKQAELKPPTPDQPTDSQRRAAYRLRQYPTRIGMSKLAVKKL